MFITTQDALSDFVAQCQSQPYLTIDTEFLREKTYYSKLCLVQIGMPDGTAAAIDPLVKGLDLEPVFDLLRNPDIMKVLHAARQDFEIFYQLMGSVPAPFFDTQIAAMVCGLGDQIGYEALIRKLCDVQIDKTAQYTDWSLRPLSEAQIDYALGDVTYLVKAYEALNAKLAKSGRARWVMEEEASLGEPALYANDPQLAWQRVKIRSPKPAALAILRDLAAWREDRAQKKNIPRTWVMRDEALAELAIQAPTSEGKLKKSRGLPAAFQGGDKGKMLLSMIKKAKASDPSDWPKKPQRKQLSADVNACVDILKMLLRMRASQLSVAPRLIAGTDDLELIAQKGSMAKTPTLSGWRREVFGDYALALKEGSLSIGFHKGDITLFEVTDATQPFRELY